MKSNAYNSHESRARTIVSENSFARGMKYSNNPLSEGYVKTLINYVLANDGMTIKPRPGYRQIADNIASYSIDERTQDFCVYFTENLLVSNANETDAILCRTVLSGAINVLDSFTQAIGYALQLFDLSNANITIAYKGNYITGTNCVNTHIEGLGNDEYYLAMQACSTSIHECPLEVAHSRNGIHAVMDNCAYVPLVRMWKDEQGTHISRNLAIINMQFNETLDAFDWWLDLVDPKDVTAVQAVNYGYNMLQENPYMFKNQEIASGALLVDGVLPYDAKGNLLTSARAGAEIFFRLIYRYPKADVDSEEKYVVRWSIQDLESDAEPVIVHDYTEDLAAPYTPGATIEFRTTQTTYKRFTLIANVYKVSEIGEGTEPKPAATITLAYYYLTNDKSTSTLNIDAVHYDLGTAQGMCTWQQRLVLWGVTGAKNILWVSEINDPSWFPYPNNCEIFPDDIVSCVRYKTHLLVFTRSALYQISLKDDGLTYTTTCMQERLTMEPEDISSIIPVQNMVFFKNGNAYYMIVPVSSSMSGELQLAPISRPIELLFTDFKTTVINLLEGIVKPTSFNYYIVNEDGVRLMDEEYHALYLKLLDEETVMFKLYDWWCLLENRTIRIYYKFQMTVGTKVTYLDAIFNYDTSTRAWTMSMVNSTRYRMTHYISSVTAETIFAQPVLSAENTISLNLIQGSEESTIDNFEIDYDQEGWNETLQYLDTGFRDLDTDIKKRFRQVQFRVNNLYSETLKFYTSFAVDNDMRKNYCNFETTEITDPEAEDYGSVYVDAVLEEPDLVWGSQEQRNYCTEWELDTSRFPNTNTAQVRFNVSGKGNLCRFELRSYNDKQYEISSVAWVYRPMYAR